jgi:hypothetical protein
MRLLESIGRTVVHVAILKKSFFIRDSRGPGARGCIMLDGHWD